MASSYTNNLRLVLPVTGENQGTWGDLVNTGLTSLLDSAISGTSAIGMTDANYTLTTSNGAADQARSMFITLAGTLTATRNVICPAVSKLYFVTNATTGGQAIIFKTAAGTGITVDFGQSIVLYCNGTDVVNAISNVGGGGSGGGTNLFCFENDIHVTTNYSITTNKNAMSAGPIIVDSGVTVVVPAGSVWTIV
jgi:hypothetical protein